MTTFTTCGMAISVDGFVAGPDQTLDNPMGVGGMALHRWAMEEPELHVAEHEALVTAGAYVMGRNMFTAGRGEWDLAWEGWWEEEPPFHAPVFVLTHHPRPSLEMKGGTTFHFVTEGFDAALALARAEAGERPVDISGGASTVNQALAAGVVDELWLHIAPITLGAGERLFEGVGGLKLQPVETRHTDLVTHVRYRVLH